MDEDDAFSPLGFTTGQEVFKRFELIRQLGFGGFAEVWLARDLPEEGEIALKFINLPAVSFDTRLQWMIQEFDKLGRLDHPNIVRVFDFYDDKSRQFTALAMEYLSGGTLREYLRKSVSSCLNVNEIVTWIEQLCLALDFIHSSHFVHRDLNPRNLMLDAQGNLRVMDFGIARRLETTDGLPTQGIPNTAGTREFRSPEQVAGRDAAVTDDIYSLAVVLYQLLTGSLPISTSHPSFQSSIPISVRNRRDEKNLRALDPVPESWDRTILRCLAKTPEGRPQSAGDVWKQLNGFCEPGRSIASTAVGWARRLRPKPTDIAVAINSKRISVGLPQSSRLVWERPVVLKEKSTGKILKAGKEAVSSSPETADAHLIWTVQDDFVADDSAVRLLLKRLFEEIVPDSKKFRVAVNITCGATDPQRKALLSSFEFLNNPEVHLIRDPMAAALGSRVDAKQFSTGILHIGRDTTQVAVIGGSVTLFAKAIPGGLNQLRGALANYFRQQHSFELDTHIVDLLLRTVGADMQQRGEKVKTNGRLIGKNRGASIEVPAAAIVEAVSGPISRMLDTVYDEISGMGRRAPAVPADMAKNGCVITGDGAVVRGLQSLVHQKMNWPVRVTGNPRYAVFEGLRLFFQELAKTRAGMHQFALR